MKKISELKFDIRNKAKETLFNFLGNSYLINKRIKYLSLKKNLTILNLHRVAEDDLSCYRPLNPEIFKELIIFLRNNYQITSFSELRQIENIRSSNSNKPKVILSFDDGYKDFITVVHPILMNEGIRANQNIIPKCVETGNPPLNVAINDFLGKTNKKEWKNIEIPGYSWGENINTYQEGLKLSTFIKNKPHKIQKKLEKIIRKQIGEKFYELSTPMLSKEEILEIFKFYDWGAHSFDHANMAEESNRFFINDLKKCKDWFKNNLCYEPYIYAFPNGSYREEQIEIAYKYGFLNPLLVNDDFSSTKNRCHDRFGFDASSFKEMKVKATGFIRKFFI